MLTTSPRVGEMTVTASPHLALVSEPRRIAGRASRLLVVALTAALMLLASCVWATPALAHTRLVQSDPPHEAVLQAPPHQVTLTFADKLDPALAQITVYAPSGEPVTTSDPRDTAPAGAATTLTVDVGPLPAAGRYEVSYLVTAGDGHPVSDAINFTLAAAPAASTVEHAPAPPADVDGVNHSAEDTSTPAWIWILGACSLVGAAVAVVLLRTRALR